MDDNIRKEKMKISVLNTTDEPEHFHQDIELLYVLEGTMDVTIGEQVTHMEPEDVLVVNANKRHQLKGSGDILYVRFSILYQMVSDVFRSMDVIFWCDSTRGQSERYNQLRDTLKILLNHYLETRGNSANFGHIGLCYRVLDILSMYFLVQASDKENLDDKEKFEERIQQINNYIRANYNQPISLKELADKLYLSNGYLSRFFKRNYGMSFAEYLTNIRLYHAVDELLYTSTPITRIAYDNGFANVAIFNKAFKKAYGETPSSLRKRSKEQAREEEVRETDTAVEERLEHYLHVNDSVQEEGMEIGFRKDIFSVQKSEKLWDGWGRTMNIGSAASLLRSEVQEHVMLLKEALGFTYARFWNIFAKEMLIDLDILDGSYNFTRLDSILDFLLQYGLKPHIELGMKPVRFMRNVQTLFQEEGDTGYAEPEKWERVLHALMRHLVHRYGRSELDSWRMEVWFHESRWEQENAVNEYYELFGRTSRIVKHYSDQMEVGGCGLRLDFRESWRAAFLEGWGAQDVKPDFLSICYFSYERGEIEKDRYAKRSTDNECMKHRILYEKGLIEQTGLRDVKLYITEWNLTASARSFINDTCFKGAYVIKNILDIYGEVADMAFFLGSDRISEYYDSNRLLHGGTGVMSKDGILKPTGFAFEFLKRLYPYYIGRGENYLISTDQHDSYGIICHNQRKLGYNYYFTKEDEIEKEHLWKYFEDRNGLELCLTLTDVTDGVYQVKTYRINEQNGSALNIWQEMDYEKELSRNDIKYFRRVCEPKLTIQKCESREGVLSLQVQMQPNEIAFVRIRLLV